MFDASSSLVSRTWSWIVRVAHAPQRSRLRSSPIPYRYARTHLCPIDSKIQIPIGASELWLSARMAKCHCEVRSTIVYGKECVTRVFNSANVHLFIVFYAGESAVGEQWVNSEIIIIIIIGYLHMC